MVAGVPNSVWGNEGEMFVSQLKSRYSERVLRGSLFHFMLAATTTGIAAGNITGAAAAAATQFAVWNPTGSGKNLSLLKFWIGPISGTVAGGPLLHNVATAPSIATVGTINNCFVGGAGALGTKMAGVASAAGTALTGGGALSAVRPSSLCFSAVAFASAAGSLTMEDIDGSIVLAPGQMWVPCWAAAGTTVLNAYGAMWEEIPQ